LSARVRLSKRVKNFEARIPKQSFEDGAIRRQLPVVGGVAIEISPGDGAFSVIPRAPARNPSATIAGNGGYDFPEMAI
jgi:hypothetical protein